MLFVMIEMRVRWRKQKESPRSVSKWRRERDSNLSRLAGV
jgi:hypothetical protein